ncbi:hypothetical protein N7492_004210 [Penicillium capsulatum]|uniref:Uncharacterized protein n=1 Tax=Penicillium capsulatum TaxID=69766 RepID=A0A9W9ID90_9EURO|nr:hypothetical protein N7492_004210 [Penicillium capsulatum]
MRRSARRWAVAPAVAGGGSGVPAAYGPREEGPDPTVTPANGGYRGAAPSGNLGVRRGQRPSVHRPHQRRAPRGPRASATAAGPRRPVRGGGGAARGGPGKALDQIWKIFRLVGRRPGWADLPPPRGGPIAPGRPARAPPLQIPPMRLAKAWPSDMGPPTGALGKPGLRYGGGASVFTPGDRGRRAPSTGGRDRRAGPTHTPGKPVRNETARVWRDEVTLASTHTLRPCLELDTPCIHESAQKWLAGNELTMGVGPRDGRGRPPRHPPAPPRHPLGTAVGIPAPERAPPRHRRACWGRRGAAAARLAGEGVRGTGGVEIYLWDPGRPDDGGGVHWGHPPPWACPAPSAPPPVCPPPTARCELANRRARTLRVPPSPGCPQPPPAPGRPAPPPPVPPPWPAANWRPRAALQRPAVTPSPTRRPRPPAHAPIAAPPTGRPPRPCRGAAGPAPRPGDPGRPPCAAERPLPRAPRAPHPPGRPRRGVSASLSTQTLRPRLESDTPCIHESAQKWLAGNELTMGVGPRDGRGHVRAHRMSARPRPRRGLDSAPARATAARGPAGTAPLQAPGAAGALDGEQQGYLTAYTTRLVTSVVCRGSIPARGDIAIRQPAPGGFSPGAVASLLRCVARRPIRIQLRRAGRKSPRSGTDSDLEAFSHYPADGSVAALPGQTAAKTNYLNQRFLSY